MWIGAAVPVGLDCDLFVWVDRRSGESLGTELARPANAVAVLDRLFQGAVDEGGAAPKKLSVHDKKTAIALRERIEGVPVGAVLDNKAVRLVEAAADDAPCLAEETAITLDGGETVFTLKVTLRRVAPPVWRRIRIAGDVSLYVLHVVLQQAMGWENCHLHEFQVDGVRYGMSDEDAPADVRREETVQVQDVLAKGVDAEYWYDFGDDWMHDIKVEATGIADPGEAVASCVGGARACPPEDAGGPQGYADKLQALAEPQDEDDEELRAWMGEDFDPEAFHLEHVDRRVAALFAVGGALDGAGEWLDDDEIECLYDANCDPDPDEWLEMDEGERDFHVRLYHERLDEPHPTAVSLEAHACVHAVVENQVALGEPAAVRTTLRRLQRDGLSRHEAVHAVGSVLADALQAAARSGFDELRYVRDLKRLTAEG